MAVFHHLFSSIKRASHTCCMATAAYRSGSKLKLKIQVVKSTKAANLQEVIFDYSTKKGIGFSKVITTHIVPRWLKNREALWQFIEDSYPNKKILACESTFALPEELSLNENTSLVLEYVKTILLNIYQIIDVNIHNENSNNPHVHLMSPLILFAKADMSGVQNINMLNYKDILASKIQLIEDSFVEVVNKHLVLKGSKSFISNKLDKIVNYDQLRPWL